MSVDLTDIAVNILLHNYFECGAVPDITSFMMLSSVNTSAHDCHIYESIKLAIQHKRNFWGLNINSWIPPDVSLNILYDDSIYIINHTTCEIAKYSNLANLLGLSLGPREYTADSRWKYTDNLAVDYVNIGWYDGKLAHMGPLKFTHLHATMGTLNDYNYVI